MKQGKGFSLSTWHEEVYHAASRCQAASLPLTARRLHGLTKPCQVERQKTGGCFASLGGLASVFSPGSFKDGGLIGLFLEPHACRQTSRCQRTTWAVSFERNACS